VERLAGIPAALACCAALSACEFIDNVNREAYAQYHASRWQAVAAACDSFGAYEPPQDPPTPRVCEEGIAEAYRDIVVAYSILDRDWNRLVMLTEEALPFIAEMLSVLDKRDTVRIETLAPQIEQYAERQAEREQEWRASKQRLRDAQAALREQWQAVWPENNLDFDLGAAIAAQRTDRVPQPGTPRHAALSHFHENEYSRLARQYLGYEPREYQPLPQSHVPADCAALADALHSLEAGLLLRYSVDQAAGANARTVSELTGADLRNTPWEKITVPPGRYGDRRVPAAVARLRLLKQLDELLTSALDVLVREVQLEWDEVWPGIPLETNIFAFAGLKPAAGQP